MDEEGNGCGPELFTVSIAAAPSILGPGLRRRLFLPGNTDHGTALVSSGANIRTDAVSTLPVASQAVCARSTTVAVMM